MILRAALIAGLVAWSTAFACQGENKPPADGPPAAELLAKMDSSDFWIVFDADTGGDAQSEGLSWIKLGSVNRLDVTSAFSDFLLGDTVLKDHSTGAGWTCVWQIGGSEGTRSTCWDYPWESASIPALVAKVVDGLRLSGGDTRPFAERNLLGTRAFCYRVMQLVAIDGRICISSEGMPLAVDATYQLGTGMTVHATAESTHDMPTDDGWKAPVSEQAELRKASPRDLRLPKLPLVDKWLAK